MVQELQLTPATVVLLAIILVGVFFAVRRMQKKGMCDCSDHCDGCGKKKGCSACRAAENLERL